MSFEIERQLIEQAFQTGMAGDRAIQWGNTPNPEPPASGFVRLSILGGQGILAGIAGTNSLNRTPGVIDVGIFTPRHVGQKPAREKADTIAGFLANKSFTSGSVRIVTFGARLDVIGESGDWFQANLSIPFQRDN